MRWGSWLLLVSCAAGCGDDSGGDNGPGGGGGAGTVCSSDTDCPSYGCECQNRTTHNKERSCKAGRCEDPQIMCTEVCTSSGGLVSFGVEGSVADSAECKAFCDKVTTECPGARCNTDFSCYVYKDSCAESVKADLACFVREATLSCSQSGYSFNHPPCTGAVACGD